MKQMIMMIIIIPNSGISSDTKIEDHLLWYKCRDDKIIV